MKEINKDPMEEYEKDIYDEKGRKINVFQAFIIFMVFLIICTGIYIILDTISSYKEKQAIKEYVSTQVDLTEDGLIPYVAKVKSLEIGPTMVSDNTNTGTNDTIYIIDYDNHIFYTYFSPELLFLDDGEYIKVYYGIEYFNNNIIKIDRYKINDTLETEYITGRSGGN